MTISAVVFDLFGTLVSVLPWLKHEGVVAEMARVIGAPVPEFIRLFEVETFLDRETGVYGSVAQNIAEICSRLGISPTKERISQAADLRYRFTRQVLTLRPDAFETINSLREQGYKIGLISDCSPEVPTLWPQLSIASLIPEPVFSSEVGYKKPAPEIFALALARLGVPAEECLYVGDGGSNELNGAKKAGMTPVLLRVPGEEIGDEMRPDVRTWDGSRIDSLAGVMTFLTAKN